MDSESHQSVNIDSLHKNLRNARRQILDMLQVAYGHEPSWRNVRSRVLKIMGREGLEKPFLETISKAGHGAKNGETSQKI